MDRLRLLLRSVYLRGIVDERDKKADMSWEDGIVEEIRRLKDGLSFGETLANKFGRRWVIRSFGKIIHQGYDFEIGKELFKQLKEKS